MTEKTILIVEAQVFIALDIQRILEERNLRNTVFARGAEEIAFDAPVLADVGLAIIDYSGEHSAATCLIDHLRERGIPCILTSSRVRHRTGLVDWPDTQVLIKPFDETDFAEAVHNALARRPG